MLSSFHGRLIYSLKFWSICIFFMKFFRIISLPTMVSLSSIYFVTLTTSCLIFHYDKIKQDSSKTNSFLLPAVSTKSWAFPHYREFKLKLKWLENGAEIFSIAPIFFRILACLVKIMLGRGEGLTLSVVFQKM